MSSGTQYRMRPQVPPTYSVTTRHGLSGVQVLDLTQMLGKDGYHMAQATLNDPATGWQCVSTHSSGEALYRHEIQTGLPADVSSLAVELRFRGGVAEVTHRWTYQKTEVRTTTQASAVPAGVAEEVRRVVGRSVNTVLMHTLNGALREKLRARVQTRQRQGVTESLHEYLRQTNQTQLLVRVRSGAGR